MSRRRESVEEKGRRYLLEGRLTMLSIDARGGIAYCRGDTGTYMVRHSLVGKKRGWQCECPNPRPSARCSHIVALQLVLMKETKLAQQFPSGAAWHDPKRFRHQSNGAEYETPRVVPLEAANASRF